MLQKSAAKLMDLEGLAKAAVGNSGPMTWVGRKIV
jgi:hypothetical protein